MKKYSQIRATLAIAKASLKATFRNPSSVFFGIVFPLIFILIFGFIGSDGVTIEVGLKNNINKENPIYLALAENESIEFIEKSEEEIYDELEKGTIDAIFDIDVTEQGIFKLKIETSSAASQGGAIFTSIVGSISDKINISSTGITQLPFELEVTEIEGQKFSTIDFILPCQLGFALLSTGVFSTSFVFISLRDTLVLKRFFATPVSKTGIIIGEALSRLVFAIMQALIIIGVGYFFLDFTLINGFMTLLTMLVMSGLALIVFLGFGFVVSNIAKDENAVPPLANLITMPQLLLAGTFFPIEVFPAWLQPISKILPLTYLNDAMRAIAFEGASLFDVRTELLVLLIWGVIIYTLAIRYFKWE
jgi:ABC-2 type transport system permease protein